MTQKISLKVQERKEEGKKVLTEGFLPGVVYGPGIEPQSIKVKKRAFEQVFAVSGESNLIDLNIEGKEKSVKVLVKDIQKDAVKGFIKHIDFYQMDMKKEINVEIPLNFIGESKAVKEMGGVVVKGKNILEVKCLAEHLVDHIDVDLSVLNTFGDLIKIKDIKAPEGIEFLADEEEMVVHVMEPKKEEEVVAAPAAEPAKDEKKEEKKEEKK